MRDLDEIECFVKSYESEKLIIPARCRLIPATQDYFLFADDSGVNDDNGLTRS